MANSKKYIKYHLKLIIFQQIINTPSLNYSQTIAADNLKKLRFHFGLTQELMAEVLNVTTKAYQRWEGEYNNISLEALTKIPQVFNCDLVEFLTKPIKKFK